MSNITAWLENLGLSKYQEIFAENEIDFEILSELTEPDLEKIGIPLGPRKKLLKAIANLVPADSVAAGSTTSSAIDRSLDVPQTHPPGHLAEQILNSRSAIEGERKQVTILFADIKNSTELVEHLDAERANDLLLPVLEQMMAAVHHYEGTVNKVQGDGIMAIFGAPIAHEDHAVRACYAALAMQEAMQVNARQRNKPGPPIQIRVGLHSGEVVVRAINNYLSMSYDALGMAVHLAARMEQLIGPDTCVLPVPQTRAMYNAVVDEVFAVAQAHDIALPEAHRQTAINWPDRLEPAATTLLQRDLAEGRASELEEQIGVVVRVGRKAGVEPVIHAFVYNSLLPGELQARGQMPKSD